MAFDLSQLFSLLGSPAPGQMVMPPVGSPAEQMPQFNGPLAQQATQPPFQTNLAPIPQVTSAPLGSPDQPSQNPGAVATQNPGPQPQAPVSQPGAFGGILDGIRSFTGSDRGRALGDFFTGLAMGSTPQQSLGYGAQLTAAGRATRQDKEKQQAQANQTVQYLVKRGVSPTDAALLASNPTALSGYLKETLTAKPAEPTGDIKNYQYAVQNGYKGSFAQWKKDSGSQVSVNIPGAPNIGTIPPGYAAKQDPTSGAWSMEPIAGGPAAKELAEKAKSEAAAKESQKRSGDVVLQDIDRSLAGIGSSPNTTTGPVGGVLSGVPGTTAFDTGKLIDTVKANAGFDRLQAMRAASPTGGALGAVSDSENKMLQAAIGNLSQSQSREQLTDNLKRVKNIYLDIVHGAGNGPARETLGFQKQSQPPQPGAVMNGYRFKGGDPAQQSNWEVVP